MRQKQQFSSDLNIKVEPKEDVIFLGIKSRESNLKRGENMKQSISFDYQKSQWENRNNREEKMYRESSIERGYARRSNYEGPSYDRHQSYDREYDRQHERQQPPVYEKHYYHPAPQVPQAYYPPPPAYQQQYPYPQPQAPVQSQQAEMMNQMFLQFFQKMMSGQLDQTQIQTNDKQETKVVQETQQKIEEPEPAEIDLKQIQNIEHRIEVIPKGCKLNRFKFLVQKAPFQSKILVFTDGRRTNDFLRERLGDKIEGYEFVEFSDYKKDPDVGQLIFIHDDDAEGACKMKEVSIMFNFVEPREFDQYCQRCCLFSGTGKKYSTLYITTREEGKAAKIKEMLQKLEVTNFPESLDKIIEAKAADQSDEEKKVIYDESFNAIKNEKFGFKLPRGSKKEKKQEQSNNNSGGNGWTNNNNAQSNNQQNSGWGNNNNSQSNNQQNSGWGNNAQSNNNQSNGAPANDNQGWGASTTNNDNQQQQSSWGGLAQQTQQTQQTQQDSWASATQNQQKEIAPQDSWESNKNPTTVNNAQDSWGGNQAQTTQETASEWAQNDNQPQKKVHFEEQQNTGTGGW